MCMSGAGLNWDDVRIFLAVMRSTSTRKAAAKLGVSRPTVARRLDALEQRLGLALFERGPDGLRPTPAAAELLPAAEDAERSMLALTRRAHAADHHMRGPIRVTVPAVAAADLLMPDMVAFCRQWPEIELIVLGNYDVSNLAKREADVAIRFMPLGKAPDEQLTGRKVGNAWMAIYGEGEQWIGQRGAELDREWVQHTPFPELPIRGSMIDGDVLRSACAHGLGITRLPCFFAEPMLTRQSEPEPGLDIWVLVHPDLRRNPRLRAFRDAMVESIRRQQPRLEGRAP